MDVGLLTVRLSGVVEGRVSTVVEERLPSVVEGRLSTVVEGRLSTVVEGRLSRVVEGRLTGDGTVVGNRLMAADAVVLMTLEGVGVPTEGCSTIDDAGTVEIWDTEEMLGTEAPEDVGNETVVFPRLGNGVVIDATSGVVDDTSAVELNHTGDEAGNGAAVVGDKLVVFERLGRGLAGNELGNGATVVGEKAVLFARLGSGLAGDGNSCVAEEAATVEFSPTEDGMGDGAALGVGC